MSNLKQVKNIDLENQINPQTIDISFKNLQYYANTKTGKKCILNGVDGVFKSGQISAILGPSGSGKTSLLNLLCHRIKKTNKVDFSGEICANNISYNSKQFSNFASYVMQDDILMETMTVKECFQFAAKLKTAGTQEQKEALVHETIRSLKLEKCQDNFIGGLFVKGISGGERKRTSIGFELISNPACIFLDEPTSGLDSFTAYSLIHLLKQFAQNKNKTVIFTIHQPSFDIWNLFDHVILMQQGSFIYQGPGNNKIIEYFSSLGYKCPIKSNPADYLMKIMSQTIDNKIDNSQFYLENYNNKLKPIISEMIQNSNHGIQIPDSHYQTTFWFQTKEIAKRQLKIFKRNPLVFKARFFQSIFIGLLFGAIYWQIPGPYDNPTQRDINDRNGLLFFWTTAMFMMNLKPSILTFPAQRAVFLREENSKFYTVGPYFLAKTLVDIIPAIIFPIICSLVIYWMANLNHQDAGTVFFFLLTCCVQALTGLALGFFGGSAFSNPKTASALTPLLMMPLSLFSGFYKNSSDFAAWIGWIQYLSPFKYCFSALAQNEYSYDGIEYPFNPIKQLSFNLSKWESIIVLASLFVLFITLAFILLSTLKKRLQ
ncbi:ABC transporter family protein (macronuclear) [Tetrahymena thermophila SB210]|uniref:ABC transporter family protein n=1 Tax=Tetrahymena thermophila (strain SB210) TaxID=312017 RepID=Q22MN4_TETTS|nr:ABC transporter family protein [Tetrahymena thermophila SB210]EAR86482.2 ABC transporter family protein [Tetrahymena thermophila SB210]|eukprot:XP_976986.2 ABC transporter family protein [Tetrahymena thermophila SB210]